jgi:hypothetical protein
MVPAGEYPELRLKAWTSRVLTAYLAIALQDVCSRFTNANRPAQLALATAACAKLAEWMLIIEKSPRYLTEDQANSIHRVSWESPLLNWELQVLSVKSVIAK